MYMKCRSRPWNDSSYLEPARIEEKEERIHLVLTILRVE
jgi:hypothetical protein